MAVTRYSFEDTFIEGVKLITPFFAEDERGVLKKSFEKQIFSDNGIDLSPFEEIETTSKRGVLRGVHFQTKNSQAKLIRVSRGAMLDVAVDLRKDSKTFGKYFSVILSEQNRKMLYIPPNFGHGCLSMIDNTTFYYLCSSPYCPEFDSGIIWNDPQLNINWDSAGIDEIILSEKDKNLLGFKEFFKK